MQEDSDYSNSMSHSAQQKNEEFWKKNLIPESRGDSYIFGDPVSDEESLGHSMRSNSFKGDNHLEGQIDNQQNPDPQRSDGSLQEQKYNPNQMRQNVPRQRSQNSQNNSIEQIQQNNHHKNHSSSDPMQDHPRHSSQLDNNILPRELYNCDDLPIDRSIDDQNMRMQRMNKAQKEKEIEVEGDSYKKGQIFGGKGVMIGGGQDHQDLDRGRICQGQQDQNDDPQLIGQQFSLPQQLIQFQDENRQKQLKEQQHHRNISSIQLEEVKEQMIEKFGQMMKESMKAMPQNKQFQNFRIHFQNMARETIKKNNNQSQQFLKNQLNHIKDLSIKNSQVNQIVNQRLQQLEESINKKIDENEQSNRKRMDQLEDKIDSIAATTNKILQILQLQNKK